MESVRSGLASTQPTRQPVTEYVLLKLLTRMVRSRMPGSMHHGDVLCAVVENVFVDLIGDRQGVEFLAEARDEGRALRG